MMRMRRLPLLLLVVASGPVAIVVGCSDSTETRAAFEGDDDAATDSGTKANLPEAAPPTDAPVRVDAGADAKAPFDPADEPVTCAGTPCVVELAAGEFHVCARMSDGTARCWGDDSKGALGRGVPDDAGAADAGSGDAGGGGFIVGTVAGLTGITQISAGGTTSCARIDDGSVMCWGGNDKGQLGLTPASPATFDTKPHPVASPVAMTEPAVRIDVGQTSACAVGASGDLWCWGNNAQRQLARSDTTPTGGPARASLGGLKIARAVPGSDTVVALTDTGDVVTWGAVAGPEGTLSGRVAAISPDPLPLAIELGSASALSVSSTTLFRQGGFPPVVRGIAHACVVVRGEVYCWGDSRSGALATGLPDPSPFPTPVLVESESAWPQQVAAAGEITCVRLTDGTVQCAGDDKRGALARGTEGTFSMFFTPATAFTGHAVQVVATKTSVCALVQGGTVECWGSNERGELGQGTTDTKPHPVPVKVGF